MKYKRQGQILRIIHEKNIKTHEQLIGELNKCGYNVTQATVSRDIKELGLIKIPLPDGGSVYSSSKDIPEELDRRINMITDTVISVDYAMNNIREWRRLLRRLLMRLCVTSSWVLLPVMIHCS